MKKILIPGFTGILLALAITGVSYSQSSVGSPKPESSNGKSISSSEEKKSASVRLNELNIKAVRNSTRDFKNVSDVKWFKLYRGSFVVYFIMDGIRTRALYDKKGYLIWTIRDYLEDILPREIRHLIKSIYYDFSIYLINEVTVNRVIAYYLTIGDKTSNDKTLWKIIKVVNGEMEIIREYSEKK